MTPTFLSQQSPFSIDTLVLLELWACLRKCVYMRMGVRVYGRARASNWAVAPCREDRSNYMKDLFYLIGRH